MPGTDNYGQSIPVPALTDAPNAFTGFDGIVEPLTQRSVMRFASASARTATLTSPVGGMVTYSSAEDRYDVYTAGLGWVPLTTGTWNALPYGGAFNAFAGTPGYRLVNGVVELRGQVGMISGGTFTNAGSPYVIATLPSGYRPTGYSPQLIGATELATNYYYRLGVGTDGTLNAYIPSGGSPHWVGLDGLRIPLT
jgi:hypothetical protein